MKGRKKKSRIPEYVLQHFPPDCRAELLTISSDSDSDTGSDQSLIIPKDSIFVAHDGKPDLQVHTRNCKSWTPVPYRTRSKLKT